jgi:hypothetical protein
LRRWCYLAGYCLRPGFGDPLDSFRVDQLWKVFNAPPRPRGSPGSTPLGSEPRLLEGGADYWIMWRRVSGGLGPSLQLALFDRLRPALLPAKGKAAVKPGANEFAEMWRAAASLERLDVQKKEALGQTLLKPLRRSPVPTYGFWALTRMGARVPVYGPLNSVLHPQVVERWLDQLIGFEPGNDNERVSWAFCLSQLARRSGQRALDIDDSHRQTIIAILRSLTTPQHWLRMVEEVLELETEEEGQLLGDALPIGLRLRAATNQATS